MCCDEIELLGNVVIFFPQRCSRISFQPRISSTVPSFIEQISLKQYESFAQSSELSSIVLTIFAWRPCPVSLSEGMRKVLPTRSEGSMIGTGGVSSKD